MGLTKTTIELPKEGVVEIDGVSNGTKPAGDYVVELSEGVHNLKITFSSGYIFEDTLHVPKSTEDLVIEGINSQGLKTPAQVQEAINQATAGMKTPEQVQAEVTQAIANSQGYIVFNSFHESTNTLNIKFDSTKTPKATKFSLADDQSKTTITDGNNYGFNLQDSTHIKVFDASDNLLDELDLSNFDLYDLIYTPEIKLSVYDLQHSTSFGSSSTEVWFLTTSKSGLANTARTKIDSTSKIVEVDWNTYEKVEFFDDSTGGNSLGEYTSIDFWSRHRVPPLASTAGLVVYNRWSVSDWDILINVSGSYTRVEVYTDYDVDMLSFKSGQTSQDFKYADGIRVDIPISNIYLFPRYANPTYQSDTVDENSFDCPVIKVRKVI